MALDLGEFRNQIKGQINLKEPPYLGEIPEPDKTANWSRGGSWTWGHQVKYKKVMSSAPGDFFYRGIVHYRGTSWSDPG